MPTNAFPTSRYATMTAAQVLAETTRLLAQYRAEDAARLAANRAALMAA